MGQARVTPFVQFVHMLQLACVRTQLSKGYTYKDVHKPLLCETAEAVAEAGGWKEIVRKMAPCSIQFGHCRFGVHVMG